MALIGSLAINMSVRTQALVQGLNKASAAIKKFGAGLRVGEQVGYMTSGLKSVVGWGAKAAESIGSIVGPANLARLKAMGSTIGFVGRQIGKTYGFAKELGVKFLMLGGIGAAGLYKTATAASSLGEQTDRAVAILGKKNAAQVFDTAKQLGTAFGVSQSEFTGSVGKLGGQFVGMGYAKDDATKLSIAFSKLALDMSSVTQVPVEEAFTRMASGLSGESEAVKAWGVDLQEANVKLKMQVMGMKATGGEFTQQQKSQARMAIMIEKLAYAQGNLAGTADSAENAGKGLQGRIENLSAQIGTTFLPIVADALTQINVGVTALSIVWEGWFGVVDSTQVGVINSVKKQSDAMGWLQKSVGWVADTWQEFGKTFSYVQSYITAGLSKMIGGIAQFGGAIAVMTNGVAGLSIENEKMLNNMSADLKRLSKEEYKTYGEKSKAPPASDQVNKLFEEAKSRIELARAEASKTGFELLKDLPTAVAAAGAGALMAAAPAPLPVPVAAAGDTLAEKEKKAKVPRTTREHFAKAAVVGTQEAANAFLRSRYGGGAGKRPEEQTATNTARAVEYLKQIATTISGSGAGAVMEAPGSIIGTVLGGLF